MTSFQRIVKYLSIGLASFLAVSIIIGGISILGLIFGFGSDEILDDPYDIEISQDIESIEIDISAASLKIVKGDKFSLSTNIEKVDVSAKNSRLYIKQKQKIVSGKAGDIILTIPDNIHFKSFELDAGAGEVDIEVLNAKNVEIDMGAGALTVRDGNIDHLNLDLGVGETNLTAVINGDSEINCGVGETNINIRGEKSSYSLDINTGIGSVTIDNTTVKGNTVIGNGDNKIAIDGGVGSINIKFIND